MALIEPPEFVRITEAARILGVCIETLRNWDRTGKLRPQKSKGRHRFYSTEELEKILLERQQQS